MAEEVAVQPDGKIVVAGKRFTSSGDFAVARYNTDGSLDATFGTGGLVFTDLNGGSYDSRARWRCRPTARSWSPATRRAPVNPADEDFAVVRYNSDGSLDTTFGTGGIVLTDFGAEFFEGAFSVAIDSAGRIVAAGGTFDFTTQRDFAVARYNPDGSLDTTFDGDGRVTTAISLTNFDIVADVAIQATIASSPWASRTAISRTVRYNIDGSLDTTFGGTGIVATNFGGICSHATAVVVQPDAKVLVVGTTTAIGDGDFALVRYNADGTPDASFGSGGQVTTDFLATDGLIDVALQADGKIVVTGRSMGPGASGDDFAVSRYEADGTLDTTFGVAGIVRTDIAASSDDARGIAIQADGKILVVGQTAFGTTIGAADFAIVRYEGPPPHDLTFYLHGTDIAGHGRRLHHEHDGAATQVLVTASNSPSWFSDPVVNGTFLTGSTFQVTLPCLLGVGLPKTVRMRRRIARAATNRSSARRPSASSSVRRRRSRCRSPHRPPRSSVGSS